MNTPPLTDRDLARIFCAALFDLGPMGEALICKSVAQIGRLDGRIPKGTIHITPEIASDVDRVQDFYEALLTEWRAFELTIPDAAIGYPPQEA